MFYIENGKVMAVASQGIVCDETEIEKAIYELSLLNANQMDGDSDVESDDERYTAEGIDRYFQADPKFEVSIADWQEDAPQDWAHLTGPELWNRYQKHAEWYLYGCDEHGHEPTYEGFRRYLIDLRNMGQPT